MGNRFVWAPRSAISKENNTTTQNTKDNTNNLKEKRNTINGSIISNSIITKKVAAVEPHKPTTDKKQFKDWSFGTINIRSGKEKDEGAKIYSLTKEIAKAGLSFCCLQEVKYRNSGKKLIRLDTGECYEFHWCGMKKRREAGVGLLIKVDQNIVINRTYILDPRIISINIKIYGFNTRIVSVYSPTETEKNKTKKDSFYRLLLKACHKKEKHEKIIIAGDFNAKTSLAFQKCCYDGTILFSDTDCNDNGNRLKEFCMRNQLCIASTYFDYPIENRYTWYSCDKRTKKINDYVLTEKYVQQYVLGCISRPDIDLDSDHRILITSMCTPTTRRARWKPKRKKILTNSPDVKALKNTESKKLFLIKVERELTVNNKKNLTSDDISTTIIERLKSAAESSLPGRKRSNRCKEIWKDDKEFNNLLTQRQKLQKHSPEYKSLTRAVKKRIVHLRNEKLRQEAEEINENVNRRQVEELYKNFKEGYTTFVKVNEKHCDTHKLKDYFKAHFNPSPTSSIQIELLDAPKFIEELQNLNDDDTQFNTDPPNVEELRTVIKSLKNGKSSNDIPSEYIKHAIDCKEFLEEMVKLYKTIWNTNKIPTSWGHSKLIAIWKGSSKGSQHDPATYRGVQIGSTLCKILAILLISRLKDWYESQLMDQQQGFRSGRGTTDGIYIIKRIHQITDNMKKPVYALFIDLTAAFDHVNRKLMFKTLNQRLASSDKKLFNLLETLYSHTTTA